MQSIERYGVIALIFLVVTVVGVLSWGSDEGSGEVHAKETVAAAKRPEGREQAPRAGTRQDVDDGKLVVTSRPRPRPLRRDQAAAQSRVGREGQDQAGFQRDSMQAPSGASNGARAGIGPRGAQEEVRPGRGASTPSYAAPETRRERSQTPPIEPVTRSSSSVS